MLGDWAWSFIWRHSSVNEDMSLSNVEQNLAMFESFSVNALSIALRLSCIVLKRKKNCQKMAEFQLKIKVINIVIATAINERVNQSHEAWALAC
ncbi:hypothetical protein BpHYR1_022983 [Brachionus plicatilis]|uniref:Uncharacterized protein n=1 Tax=Brachionus plicatilis TaxID=10195 RepID=A0A3M7SL80_BRAPC|nr:hypothetical protein BpHYR1_022983 [Brachionus plicatilis]